jgi:glycerophosphoryl diester phosphodiesterase
MDRERKKNRKRITKSFDGVFNYISNVNSQKENEIKEFEENFVNGASNRSNNSITVKNDLDSFHKKKELKDYLDQQVNLKIEMKRKNDMEERDYGNFLEEVKNKFVEESKNNIIKKKNINKENIEFLRKQIEAKKDVKNNGMNMHEYSMNKDILSNYYRESSLYK